MTTSNRRRWQLRDYVFAAFMTIGIAVASVITVPLTLSIPLPGIRTVVWAPFAGIFLTLGMARLQRSGSVALMIGVLALILSRISWIITAFLGIALLVTELVMLTRGGFYGRTNRLLGNVLFFSSATVAGTLVGAYAAGEVFAEWFSQLWLLALMTLVSGAAGAVGWWLGERVVQQLQRAGKLDAS
ncbi:MAG: hypothetical protein HC929_11325 [Leptolyngbyaceae cyanobacterium SM2_5_2]|nr:hypothetical protein [Leptolyngbyaceae cyanobacterium SM2_5_2]